MEISYIGYLLFVIPGFCFVWTYRHFSKAEKIGEFEYAAWSFVWGLIICIAFEYMRPKLNIPLPTSPARNVDEWPEIFGLVLAFSVTYAIVLSFPLGFVAAIFSRWGLFSWIDKKLFSLVDILTR